MNLTRLILTTCIVLSALTVYGNKEYVLICENPSIKERFEPRPFQTVACKDGSEWVITAGSSKERFAGFLYLKNKIMELNIRNIKPAENRVLKSDGKFFLVSRYHGATKPNTFTYMEQINNINDRLGFIDTTGGANLRVVDNIIYIFDTELSSFKPELREEIMNTYGQVYDEVINFLRKANK